MIKTGSDPIVDERFSKKISEPEFIDIQLTTKTKIKVTDPIETIFGSGVKSGIAAV